ncbi:PAS domain-containing sensor histidine kinase [Pseudomonas sp. dw_358]|uniref:sensor histidine kinase n=1 Tax=Pseudomonas sp. dw_358 TaxID=2720083 RepID=UPI001BD261E5|nr:PAS domain-containing sensor histidine kinase [Pseudomonas sp. dw_358]
MLIEPFPPLDPVLLWEQAACGLLVATEQGTITRANQTFCHWLGYAPQELVGRRLHTLLPMGGRAFHQTHWGPLLQIQGSIAEVKIELLHREGHTLPMMLNGIRRAHHGVTVQELSLFVAKDRNRYEHELINARNLAEERLVRQLEIQQALNEAQQELREAYEQAEQRAELAERMVGVVSHDLRNPLSAIKMASDLLNRNEDAARQGRVLNLIGHSVDRAQRLITDLLDFTLAQVGRGIPVTLLPLDLHALVETGVEELRLVFPGHELVHEYIGAGSFVGDSDRLHQLLGNLVANAAAYGDPDSVITISTRYDEHSVSLSVHNSGEPLSDLSQEHLFEPMTRGRNTENQRGSLGLGLFIVREIVKAHHGEVAVISTQQLGTTFIARFRRSADISTP